MTGFIKRSLILIFLSLFTAGALFSQAAGTDAYEDVFFLAQRMYEQGAYEQAEIEYKRYIFLQDYSEGVHQVQAFCALSELYEKQGLYELAEQSVYKAIISSAKEGLSAEATDALRIKHIALIEKSAEKSKENLAQNLFIFSYMNIPEFSDSVKQAAYLANLKNAVKFTRWEAARDIYTTGIQSCPRLFTQDEQDRVSTNLQKLVNFKPKKLLLAGYLSLFPGLGQLYAGAPGDALNAFLLNGTIIAASVWSVCTLDLMTFSLLEYPLLSRFMKGNVYNAQKDAHMHNVKVQASFSDPILKDISQAELRNLPDNN